MSLLLGEDGEGGRGYLWDTAVNNLRVNIMNFKWPHPITRQMHIQFNVNIKWPQVLLSYLRYHGFQIDWTVGLGCHGYTARDNKYRLIVFRCSIHHLELANLQMPSTI